MNLTSPLVSQHVYDSNMCVEDSNSNYLSKSYPLEPGAFAGLDPMKSPQGHQQQQHQQQQQQQQQHPQTHSPMSFKLFPSNLTGSGGGGGGSGSVTPGTSVLHEPNLMDAVALSNNAGFAPPTSDDKSLYNHFAYAAAAANMHHTAAYSAAAADHHHHHHHHQSAAASYNGMYLKNQLYNLPTNAVSGVLSFQSTLDWNKS